MGVPPEYYAGIAFAVSSTLATNLGILIQKASADIEKDKPLRKRWRFWAGFGLNLGSEALLTTFALALAPLSLVAPLGGLAVVFNALLARSGCVCGIKEDMGGLDWLCTGVVVAGVTMAAVFGPGGIEDPNRDLMTTQRVQAAASEPLFVVYTVVSFSSMFVWLFFWKQSCFPRLWRPHPETIAASIGSGFTAALGSGFSTIFLKVLTLQVGEWGEAWVVPVPLVWVSFFALMVVAPLQLYLLNMTLASGGATFTIPLYLSLCMLCVSISGAILFKEFEPVAKRDPAPLFIVLWGIAVLVTMLGLAVLSYRQQRRVDDAEPAPASPSDLATRGLSRGLGRRASREDAESGLPRAAPPDSAAVLGGKPVLGKPKRTAAPRSGGKVVLPAALLSPDGAGVRRAAPDEGLELRRVVVEERGTSSASSTPLSAPPPAMATSSPRASPRASPRGRARSNGATQTDPQTEPEGKQCLQS